MRVAGAKPGVNPDPSASLDTLKGRAVFGFLIPTYTTTYSLNRGETAWDQDFTFSNTWGGISVKNDTKYLVKTDPKRTDFKVREGSTTNSLAYRLADLIPLTGDFNYRRSGQTDTGRENTLDLLEATVGADYSFHLRRFHNRINSKIGLTDRTDSQLLAGSRLTTKDLGLTRMVNASSNLIGPLSGMTMKLEGNLQVSGSNARATEGEGTIQGTVSAPPVGDVVPKVFVELLRAGTLEVVHSDSTGIVTPDGTGRRFTFTDLQPGKYDLRFSAPGLETVTRSATVEVEQTNDIGDTPLSRGTHSDFGQIELAGNLVSASGEFDPAVRVPMRNIYGAIWQVEVVNVSSGSRRFKFLTGDPRGDYASDQVACVAGLTAGPVRRQTTSDGSICADFTGGGTFRITLNEEALTFRVERVRPPEQGALNNTNSVASLVVNYSPFDALTSDLTVRGTHRADSFIMSGADPTKKGRRERSTQNVSSVALNMTLKKPTDPNSELSLQATRDFTSNQRVVDVERASENSSNTVSMRLKRRILSNQLNLHYEVDNSDDRPRSRTSSKTLTRVVDGALDRVIGRRLTGRATGELRLRRQTYQDSLQDQDGLRSRMELGMTYRPDSTITGTLTGSRTLDDFRNIDHSLSQNSRYEERYSVSFGIDWRLTARTTMSQRYNYQPVFTTNRFNRPADNLLRTRDVTTTINTILLGGTFPSAARLTLSLRHQFQLQESGGYRRDSDGTRLFAVGENNYTQDMTSSLAWTATPWLNFHTDERFYRTDKVTVATDKSTISSRIEFTQGASLERPLPGGGRIRADFSYFVQPPLRPIAGRRQAFVTASVQLNKTF